MAKPSKSEYMINHNKYKEGSIIKGIVSRIVPFGVFIKLDDGEFALIKVVYISSDYDKMPTIGAEVTAVVLEAEIVNEHWKLNSSMLPEHFALYK